MTRRRGLFYLPLSPLTFVFFLLVSVFVWSVVTTTGALLGFSTLQTAAAFGGIVLGSAVNIPVATLKGEKETHVHTVRAFGVRYPVPHTERQEVVLAVNLGGAVVPLLISAYLVYVSGAAAAVATLVTAGITTVATHLASRPIRGVGIVVPTLIPAFASATGALLSVPLLGLDPSLLPRTAFAGGVVGALVGADVLNLDKIAKLGAPVASIGGAGTFDGILITGVTAVLLGAVALGL